MKFYAELNGDNICTGVKMTRDAMNDPNAVEIESMDSEYVWKQYDPTTKTWSTEKFLPDRPAIQLKEFEQLKADKEKLEMDVQGVLQMNAMHLKTMAEQGQQLKDAKALNSDLLLKLARNGIN
ncbi:hypothetical protein [Halobacillus litoralis]|uniref:Uncharacterized protein n=1 Tax=Halobacillus litoralis TaxID=45668 RepID=A0A410MCH8_9BACI|nr:hypothetical protein [Halobacillus litoralis]QAS52366.1 hypothetical protein HLI_09040 [Halobacillus litoralis]